MVRDSAPLKGDCNEQDRWRRCLDDDDLEEKDQARVTGKVLGGKIIRYGEGEPLEGDSHLLGEGDSLERSRLLSQSIHRSLPPPHGSVNIDTNDDV